MSVMHLETRAIETAGVRETKAFTMKASGKAFKVLIDGLYSDKARAVIRELCSNAYDAHAAVGKADEPFEMHLPTQWEPWFSVRDYGCSMDHDTVMGLYTTVFESSKENDNVQVGKLGLGSKSPFAYTDTFTVTTWNDGEKRTYSAYIGTDHIPQIALMGTEDAAGELNGVEVTFPVKDGDFNAFRLAAHFTMMGFNPKPITSGQALDGNKEGSAVLSGTNWTIYSALRTAYAKQGCVVYPIDTGAVKGLTEAEEGILDSGIIIDFPIGALEIAASREGLGYDTMTINAIRDHAFRAFEELQANAKAQLDAQATIWDKLVFLNDLFNAEIPLVVVESLRRDLFGKATADTIDIELTGFLEFHSYKRDQLTQGSKPKRHGTPYTLDLDPSYIPVVFLHDIANGPLQNIWGRMRNYVLAAPQSYAKSYYVKYDSRTEDVGEFIRKESEGAPAHIFVDMHALPKPATTRTSAKATVKRITGTFNAYRGWPSVTLDPKQGGYFIAVKKREPEGVAAIGRCRDLVERLRTAGVLPQNAEVYAIPHSLAHIHKNTKNGWISVVELGKAYVDQHAVDVGRAIRLDNVKSSYSINVIPEIDGFLPVGHPIQDYRLQHARKRTFTGMTDAQKLVRNIGNDLAYRPYDAAPPITLPTWEAATAAYPLLQYVSEVNHDNMQDVLDYVNFIDSRQQSAQVAA